MQLGVSPCRQPCRGRPAQVTQEAGEGRGLEDRCWPTRQTTCSGAASGSLGTELSHVWAHQGLPQKLGLGMNQVRNMVGAPLEKEGVLG